MKQLQAKLSAGILTAVLILGMVFTMTPMKADAASYQDVLNVSAVDENGTPLADVELVFEKEGETYDFDTTDANGEISGYSMIDDAEMVFDGGYGEYEIKPAANSGYTVVGNPCIVDIEKTPESYGFPYIASVNGKPYAGETVQLTLKSASSEKPEVTVTEVTGGGAEVARAGGTAAIRVKGTNLPDKFYYVMNLYDEKGRLLAQCSEKEAAAAGTETERTFDAAFPSVEDEKYQDAAYWEVGVETVSSPEDGYYTTKKEKGQHIQIAKKSETVEPKPGENPGENPPAVEKKVKSVALTKISYTYNKKAHKPGVVAKDDQGNKIPASDYTVKYSSGCKNVGKYAVTVTFKGEYKGTYIRTYNVVPQGTKLKSVKAGKKSFKATWKKQKTQTSGYQLAYSTSKNFAKNVKTTTVSKNGTVKKTVKKLSKKKTYYVKVRTYKTVKSGKKTIKLYSGWSAAKKVKTK
nr:bacterial Ig-like domain-containing protein [uncultured Mogibacterium sp.]